MWSRLSVNTPYRCFEPIDGNFYAWADHEGLESSWIQLFRALALTTVDLLPNWDSVPRTDHPALPFVSIDDETETEWIDPPTHKVVFGDSFVGLADLQGALVSIRPVTQVVESVCLAALSWIPLIPYIPPETTCETCGLPWGMCAKPIGPWTGLPNSARQRANESVW